MTDEPLDLVGMSDVAKMLGVSRSRADQLARQVDFPQPIAQLSGGRIWQRTQIEEWMATRDTAKT
jgi:predicted DNA-binding transcriptional regulator AlpA